MFEGHGMSFKYTYKGTKQLPTDSLIPSFKTQYIDDQNQRN